LTSNQFYPDNFCLEAITQLKYLWIYPELRATSIRFFRLSQGQQLQQISVASDLRQKFRPNKAVFVNIGGVLAISGRNCKVGVD